MITLAKLRPYTGDVTAPSPNHSPRKGRAIEGIVLHATADGGNEDGTLSWLRSPRSRASCHLFVGRDGRVTRLVGDRQCAWHAGGTRWRGRPDVNSATLGIEIANRNDGEPYTDAQYVRVAVIVAHYCRQGLSLEAVVGHGDIAGRAADPHGWNWVRFRTMVRRLLRAEIVDGGRQVYDRRSAERRAADEAAGDGSTDASPPAAPADRAPALTGERRSTPRGDSRALATPKSRAQSRGKVKPVLRSRTLWLNGLTAVAAGAVIVGDALDLAFTVGLSLPEETTKWVLFAVGIVNIVLRFRTSQPVSCDQGIDGPASDATLRLPVRAAGRDLGVVAAGPG